MHEHVLSELPQTATRLKIRKSVDHPGPTSKSVIIRPRKAKSTVPQRGVHWFILVLCTSRADSSQARAEPARVLRARGCLEPEPARAQLGLEQGSTSGLESVGGSSRLGQGSTSRLDSRLEPLGAFLAARAWLESSSPGAT